MLLWCILEGTYLLLLLTILLSSGLLGQRGSPGPQGPPGYCEFCNYPGAQSYTYSMHSVGNDKGP